MAKMPSPNQIKICIVTISLAKGGAERSTAILSQMLVSKGFNVYLATLNDAIDYPFAGTLYNLGENKSETEGFLKRFNRFKQFRGFLKSEKFDFIIDNRNRSFAGKELFYLHYLYRGFKIIYVVRSFKLDAYFPKEKWVAKGMIGRASKVVGVSKAIAENVNNFYKTNKAQHIYNPVEESIVSKKQENTIVKPTEMPEKYIVFLGRIVDDVKNISLLLESFKLSKLPENNINLKIIGDGPDILFIKNKIAAMNLSEKVQLIDFTPVVSNYLKNALFLTLTSFYEGFPRVLIEALSVGTPVISVDCNSGPSEIITHKQNGLLVENHNPQKFADAMNLLLFDTNLYQNCKQNATASISHLNFETIATQWEKLLTDEYTATR